MDNLLDNSRCSLYGIAQTLRDGRARYSDGVLQRFGDRLLFDVVVVETQETVS
jgi:hypothetical protein